MLKKGEEESLTSLGVQVKKSDVTFLDERKIMLPTYTVPTDMLCEVAKTVFEKTDGNFLSLRGIMLLETPMYAFDKYVTSGDSLTFATPDPSDVEDYYYSDNEKAYYHSFDLYFTVDGDKITDCFGEKYFTDEQYNNGEKVAIVKDKCFEATDNYSYVDMDEGVILNTRRRVLPQGTDSIIIGGEAYKIINVLSEYEMPGPIYDIEIPFTSVDDVKIFAIGSGEDAESDVTCLTLNFNKPVSHEQYINIKESLEALTDGKMFLQPVEFADATEIYY